MCNNPVIDIISETLQDVSLIRDEFRSFFRGVSYETVSAPWKNWSSLLSYTSQVSGWTTFVLVV